MKLAQVALKLGADDLHGTIIEEHIFHMAIATSPQLRQREPRKLSGLQHFQSEMLKAILPQGRDGRTPVQRNTFANRSRSCLTYPQRVNLNPVKAQNPRCGRQSGDGVNLYVGWFSG
jgi:2-iminoacetate synthase ThiH